jgi:hypothetical protein
VSSYPHELDIAEGSHALWRQCELLAAKLLEIGKSVLSDKDGAGALDAVKWLQRGFAITEKLEDSATPGLGQLKVRL